MRPGTRGPDDILLVIEIADSSLEYDRDVKARVYAASRVPEYWPGYQRIEPRRRGESMSPLLLPSCAIDVDALLIA
jgi:hypothetical protein